MTELRKGNDRKDRNGMALIAVALAFGVFAVTADVVFMAPHASSNAAMTSGPVTDQSSSTETPYYFPSQFTLHPNEADEQAAPSPTF